MGGTIGLIGGTTGLDTGSGVVFTFPSLSPPVFLLRSPAEAVLSQWVPDSGLAEGTSSWTDGGGGDSLFTNSKDGDEECGLLDFAGGGDESLSGGIFTALPSKTPSTAAAGKQASFNGGGDMLSGEDVSPAVAGNSGSAASDDVDSPSGSGGEAPLSPPPPLRNASKALRKSAMLCLSLLLAELLSK
jgi:hypothetical protein